MVDRRPGVGGGDDEGVPASAFMINLWHKIQGPKRLVVGAWWFFRVLASVMMTFCAEKYLFVLSQKVR